MNFLQSVKATLAKFRFSSNGGGGGGGSSSPYGGYWGWNLPSAEYDYRRNAGLLWQNPIVFALANFQANQFNQANFAVQEFDGNEWTVDSKAAVTKILQNPNSFTTQSNLWANTLLDLAISGNGYWFKRRYTNGEIAEIWHLPCYTVTPMWQTDGSDFITKYRYRVNGQTFFYDPSEIVHFRGTFSDPLNNRLGLGSFSATLKEICTENEGGTSEAANLRNRGIPGAVIGPKADSGWDPTPEQRAEISERYESKFKGDGQGRVFFSNAPIDVNVLSPKPTDMGIAETRSTAASRICAAFGVDPMVIGLPSSTKTYSNYSEALRAAWDNNIIPTMGQLAEIIDRQLMPDFYGKDFDRNLIRAWFMTSDIPALQEDENEKVVRLTTAVNGGWMTPNEARVAYGLPETNAGNELVSKVIADPMGKEKNPKDPKDAKKQVSELWRNVRN